jgi:hypothetical protein
MLLRIPLLLFVFGEAAALQILNSPQWQQFKQDPGVQKEIEKNRQVPATRLPLNDG